VVIWWSKGGQAVAIWWPKRQKTSKRSPHLESPPLAGWLAIFNGESTDSLMLFLLISLINLFMKMREERMVRRRTIYCLFIFNFPTSGILIIGYVPNFQIRRCRLIWESNPYIKFRHKSEFELNIYFGTIHLEAYILHSKRF